MVCINMSLVEDEDKSFFEKLYYTFRNSMYYVALSVVKNEHDAEDVLQNTFIKIAQNTGRIKKIPVSSRKSYLSVVTKNTAIDYIRAGKYDLMANDNEIEKIADIKSVEDTVMEKISVEKIISIINSIASPYKEVLIMTYVFDDSYETISKLTGRKAATVRKQVSRGKNMLYHKMVGDDNSEEQE